MAEHVFDFRSEVWDGSLRYDVTVEREMHHMTLSITNASRRDAERLYAMMAALDAEQQSQVSIVFEGDISAAAHVAEAHGMTEV